LATFEHPHRSMPTEAAEGLARGVAIRIEGMTNSELFRAWLDARLAADHIMTSRHKISHHAMALTYLAFLFRTAVLERGMTDGETWNL